MRWLRATWPACVALVLLLLVMWWLVTPRINLFLDHWYNLPADSAYAQHAADLRQLRGKQALQWAWAIGLAPVALLFLLQSLPVLLSSQVLASSPVLASSRRGEASGVQGRVREADVTHRRATQPVVMPETGVPGDGVVYIGQGGRYRIDRLLASGGMGSVHKGYDQTLQREVAIKELDVNLAQDPEQTGRFRQEALALAGLTHPHIVPVYDLVEDNDRFWIVMELLSGGDLESRLEAQHLTVTAACDIVRAVAQGLAFAHNKGIVHRDIKPLNILFNSEGVPKLVDFGIAKLVRAQRWVAQTQEGLSLGSPTYMSPEQVKGKKDIDKRADIYALGVTFYKLLAGDAPFTGDPEEVMRQHLFETPVSLVERNTAVSMALDAIVLKMLAKHPDERYQSLEAFVAALDAQQQ